MDVHPTKNGIFIGIDPYPTNPPRTSKKTLRAPYVLSEVRLHQRFGRLHPIGLLERSAGLGQSLLHLLDELDELSMGDFTMDLPGLVMTNITNWKITMFHWKFHYKW